MEMRAHIGIEVSCSKVDLSFMNPHARPKRLLCPIVAKPPVSVPDTGALCEAAWRTFGVPVLLEPDCFAQGVFNELYILRPQSPVAPGKELPEKVAVRIAREDKAKSTCIKACQVATMVYVKEHTSIPVPTVYAYCTEEQNSVGRPFIIMSFVPGVCIYTQQWDDLNLDCKLRTNAV
ncbi:hypothetical protein OBBRIDRAFT_520654 [Obba rivulosa]|uniref:Uncharacterized protein n=1 Tax=Obba rivulosa TaxID=1052685 RepID=A0A8E2AYQ2_9APHY|nr:hypothetical protein OBBRIDRAFT_520654 [Obba rivulosa]